MVVPRWLVSHKVSLTQMTSTAASIVQTKSLAKRMHPGGETANSSGPQQPARGGEQRSAKGQQQRSGSATPAVTPAKSDIRDKKAGHWIGDTMDLQGVWMGRAPVRAEPHTADGSEDHEPLTPNKGDKKHHESKERGGHEIHHKSRHKPKGKKPEPDTQTERARSTEPTTEDQNLRNRRDKDQGKRGDDQDEGHPENKPDGGHSSGHTQSHGKGDNQERKAGDGGADGRPDTQHQENHEQKRRQHHNRRRSRRGDEDSDGNDQFWEELIGREVQRPVVDVEDDYLEMAVQVRTYGVTWCALLSACLLQ
jgi:hypothetical protein